jgi:[ribosomal protein S18]-alanine N-acetyltransferase
MDIEISNVTIRLLDKLWAIENQCFEQEAFTKQQLAYLIADYSTIGLTALVNGEIVGFVLARVNIRRNVTFGHILTIEVAPTYRRKGIAQKLLQEIENTLRDRGVNECRLEVRENNKAALNLYRKLGYTKIGRLEKCYGTAHGLYLKKSLQ